MTGPADVGAWWARNPMTYGMTHGRTDYGDAEPALGSAAFFDRVDAVFLGWNQPLHGDRPFERIFPFDAVGPGARVLEVGCGMGTMAMTWARAGADVTVVDLNPVAVQQTNRRFELASTPLRSAIVDGRHLPFRSETFDYVYSWGVLHHSPDLRSSLAELLRVVRPGGGFGVMVYNRRSFLHAYLTTYVEGFLHRERLFLDPVQLASRYGDGAREEGNPHTWPVTGDELRSMLEPFSADVSLRTLGTDLDSVFKYLLPGVGVVLPRPIKKAWARRFGWSHWASGHKAPTTG